MENTQGKTDLVSKTVLQVSKLQKKISYKITPKALCVFLCILLFISIVPVIAAGSYARPAADDFFYGAPVRQVWQESGSIFAAVKQSAIQAKEIYFGWQGSFSACFLMGLQPDVWGTGGYGAVIWIMLGSLLLGIFMFCNIVLQRLFKASAWQALSVAAVLALVSVHLVPHPFQSFYWYNGSVYYTFFFGVSLLQYALLIAFSTATKKGWALLALASILAIFIGGGNYITAIATVAIMALITVICFAKKSKKAGWLLLPLLLGTAATAVSLIAPGNAMRKSTVDTGLPFIKSIVYSLYNMALGMNAWISLPLLALFALLVPLFWSIAKPESLPSTFRFPLLVSVGSFLFLAACMYPHLRAVGTVGPYRLYNMYFFMFVILLAGNMLYWVGWLRYRLSLTSKGKETGQAILRYANNRLAALTICSFGVIVLFTLAARIHVTGMAAVQGLRTGELAVYAQQREAWEAELTRTDTSDVTLQPLTVLPYLLIEDVGIGRDADQEFNLSVARYYNKNTVIQQNEQEDKE